MDPQNEGQTLAEGVPATQEEQKPAAEMAGLTEGRIIHYVLPYGHHRPAIVVRNWRTPGGCCNLQVFLDGLNDRDVVGAISGMLWATSVLYSAKPMPGSWHWTEKT
jgi:hypothetical protein